MLEVFFSGGGGTIWDGGGRGSPKSSEGDEEVGLDSRKNSLKTRSV